MLKTADLGSDWAKADAPFRAGQARAGSGTILKSLDEIRGLLSDTDARGRERGLPKGGPGAFLQRAARACPPHPAPAEAFFPPVAAVSRGPVSRAAVMPARLPAAAAAPSRHSSRTFAVLMAAGLLVLSASSLVVAQGPGLSRRAVSLFGNRQTPIDAGSAAAHAVLPPTLFPAVAKNRAAAAPLPTAAVRPKPLPTAYEGPAQMPGVRAAPVMPQPAKPALPQAKAAALPPVRVAPAKPAFDGLAQGAPDRSVGKSLRQAGDVKTLEGDIASARLFYERAADAGDARAALDLGNSFNPAFLARLGVRGMRGDAAAAARWYRRAISLGNPDAAKALRALPR